MFRSYIKRPLAGRERVRVSVNRARRLNVIKLSAKLREKALAMGLRFRKSFRFGKG